MLTNIVFAILGFLYGTLCCVIVWCCESERRESKAKGKETRPKMKYEIEEHLAKFGGKADKGVKRICGNCHRFNSFDCADAAEDDGCYYHRTSMECERLATLIKARREERKRERIEARGELQK
jgi:hypothetical protein